MLVYSDLISGDQMLSDSHVTTPLKHNGEEIEGIFIVQSKAVPKDIGEVNIGANASAEGGGEEVDDSVETVNNVIDGLLGFGYNGPNEMKASEFMVLYKAWCGAMKNKIIETAPEGAEAPAKPFMQSAKAFMPFLKAEFKNLEVYNPKSFNTETFVLGWWDDEANTVGAPKFIYFRHALKEEKY